MKNILRLAIATCITLFVIAESCKKKDYNLGPGSAPLSQVFAELRSTPQNLTVTAGVSQTVIGAKGTALVFYPNSFKDANGATITSGTINLQLVEMYKPGDMIQNRATTTTSGGKLLQSGGQVFLTAYLNGQKVYANTYGIGFKQSGPSGVPMKLYTGDNNSSDSATSWSVSDTSKRGTTVNGTLADSATNKIPSAQQYYLFDSCTNFGWTNCDNFWDSLNKTAISVVMPDNTFDRTNTQIFLIFPSINSVCEISGFDNKYDASTNTFTLTHGEAPIGMSYKMVAITNKSGSYYYDEKSGVITNGLSINAALAPETKGDIIARLAGL